MKASGVIVEGSDSFPIVEEVEAKKRGMRCAVYYKLLKLTVPTIYFESVLSKPSFLLTLTGFIKSPKPRIYQPDQVDSFVKKDKIHNIEEITEKHCPSGYTWHNTKDFILLYVLLFDDCSGFSTICEPINIDNSLHVELQYCCNPVPLPDWFSRERNSKLTRFSMLKNLPIYWKSFADDHSLLSELQKRKHYKPKGQPPYIFQK